MNFALIGSILWLFSTPEKNDADHYPRESLIDGAVYLIQNEADASVLNAWDPGDQEIRPAGYVNTTKFRLNHFTTWSLEYYKVNRYLTIRSQSQNNTHNELALVVEKQTKTFRRFWNVTFAGRSFGVDRWLIVDWGKGAEYKKNVGPEKCLQNHQKGYRVELANCNKTIRTQRWRFCLCSLPPLPKGHTERDRVINRIHSYRTE